MTLLQIAVLLSAQQTTESMSNPLFQLLQLLQLVSPAILDWSTTLLLLAANVKLDTTALLKLPPLVPHLDQFNAILALPHYAKPATKLLRLFATAVS